MGTNPLFSLGRRFWLDGICSADYGLLVSGEAVYNAPERDVDRVSVPGRSGDLIFDNNRLRNITIRYPAAISRSFQSRSLAAKSWLLSSCGYRRLIDDYNPDHYRLAMFSGPVDFDVKLLNRIGETDLSFDCKPQLFLLSGDNPILLPSSGMVICNPCAFPAQPIIHVYGAGTGELTVGSATVSILGVNGDITLDCEDMDAYRLASGLLINCNSLICAPEFPVLQPGENVVTWTGGIDHVEIIPRWWTL